MARSWTPLIAGALVGVMAACGDTPTAPDVVSPPVRSILLHFANSGENRVWNTDQTQVGALAGGASGLVPIGSEPGERLVAFIDGTAVVLASLDTPGELDTIIQPAPTSYTLASFSQAGDLVAIARGLGVDVEERRLERRDLLAADEVFLTGSIRGLVPARSLDGVDLADRDEISRAVADGLRRRWRSRSGAAAAAALAGARPLGPPAG